MAKLRVYELARELNIESKLLVQRLHQMGVDVASHQSTLTDAQAVTAREAISSGVAKPVSAKAPTASKKQVVIRRRRRASEPETEKPEESAEAEAVEAAPEAVAKSAEPETVVEAKEPEAIEAAAEEAEAKDAVAEEAEAKDAVAEETNIEAQSDTEESATKAPSTFKRPAKESATIVRKASPEEIAKRQQRTQRPAPSRTGSRPPSGVRPKSADEERADGSVPPELLKEETGRVWIRKGGHRDQDEKPKEEIEAAAKKAAALKSKRGKGLSAKDLLNQFEVSGEIPDPFETRNKKVYTPSHPSRRKDLRRRKDLKKTQITTPSADKRVVEMEAEITVAELAKQLSVKATEIIKKLMDMGMMVTINAPVDIDTATLLANEYNYEVKSVEVTLVDILKSKTEEELAKLKQEPRPSIVTVMGHVDHGKTSILDAIRNTSVTTGEAGGITQAIGAYSVNRNNKRVTFLDTPGHEAFSSMRARGANVTDIVVLVVAADDGVMPQTVEAISHARAAEVPIIVAVNKIDKHNINLDRVFTELAEHGIQSEEWGGDNQFVKCSAIEGTGIDELLEAILLQSEVLELKSSSDMPADGIVVEAHLDKGRGPVATVIVQNGTLKKGDHVVAGSVVGRVRAMSDHLGAKVITAGPSTPVEIIGLDGVPNAGDSFNAVIDEKTARQVADWRDDNILKAKGHQSAAQTLEDLLSRVSTEDQIDVPIIIKADTQGSVEAIAESIAKVNTEAVKNKVVHSGAGGINESDISLAQASKSVIIGFNVRAQSRLEEMAERSGVVIKYFSIIYDVVDAMKSIMAGRLPPVLNEVIIGHAEVRDPIKIPKIGLIAGSSVTDGKITRASKLRLIRDDVIIYEGKIGSLRRFKDDVSEVATGYECGISLEGYTDVREGDVIEAFIIEEHAATL